MQPTDNWWYSPQCMLLFADLAVRDYSRRGISPPGEVQKTIDEGRTAAIFALGLAEFVGAEMWLRLVHPREQAPDVRLMYFDESGPRGSHRMNILQVEVATYTRHSTESLGDFLFKVKLNPAKKAYSQNTVVVVFVQRECGPEEIQAAHKQLQGSGAQGMCFLIGMLRLELYQLVQVFPHFRGPQDIDVHNAFESSTQLAVAEVKRGMSSVQTVSAEPIPTANPFLDLV